MIAARLFPASLPVAARKSVWQWRVAISGGYRWLGVAFSRRFAGGNEPATGRRERPRAAARHRPRDVGMAAEIADAGNARERAS